MCFRIESVFDDRKDGQSHKVFSRRTTMKKNVIATEAARDLTARLKTKYGPLMFMQSGGCCAGTAPMCFREGELLISPGDALIGDIAGCPFYIDREQYERWNSPQFLIDVAVGDG